jgi:ATP-dependent Clp protease adapter protein ClpS
MAATTLFNVSTPARHVMTTRSRRRALRAVAKAHHQGARIVNVYELDLVNSTQCLLLHSQRYHDPEWYQIEPPTKG